MKIKAKQVVSIASILALMLVPLLAGGVRLKADIPFDFNIGNKVYPAGEYRLDTSADSRVLLRGKNGENAFAVTVRVHQNEGPDPQLIFNRYGKDRYFLTQIWDGGTSGRELVKSKAERELILTDWEFKKIAVNLTPNTEQVDVP